MPLGALAVGFFVLGVVQGGPWGWTDPRVLGCFVVAGVLVPVFVVRSARHPRPLLDLDLFGTRSFSVAVAAQALFVGSFFGWLVLMPSFLQTIWGWSPLAAGFALAPSPAISGLLSPFAGRLADRIGHRGLVVAGTLTGAVGTAWFALAVGPEPDYVGTMLPGMLLLGLGATTGFATLTGAIMSDIPPRFYSMAGAARSTIFQLATAVGIAISVALLGTPGADAVGHYARTWWFGTAGAAGAAAVMAVAYPGHRRRRVAPAGVAPAAARP